MMTLTSILLYGLCGSSAMLALMMIIAAFQGALQVRGFILLPMIIAISAALGVTAWRGLIL